MNKPPQFKLRQCLLKYLIAELYQFKLLHEDKIGVEKHGCYSNYAIEKIKLPEIRNFDRQ